jgi:hypothetical protein
MRDDRAYAAVVAVFAAFLYLAIVIAAFGLISLATNTDVIDDPDAGPLVGPSMIGSATVLVLVFLISMGIREQADKQRISPLAALTVGVAAYFVYAAAGGIAGGAGDPSQPFHYVLFALGQLGSLYAIVAGVAAFVVTLLYQLVLVGRFRDRGRPRWPWESDDDA